MRMWSLIDPVQHLTWYKVFFVIWGVKRRIGYCCKYWRLQIHAEIDSLCKFESYFKGQRWIVCDMHTCKPFLRELKNWCLALMAQNTLILVCASCRITSNQPTNQPTNVLESFLYTSCKRFGSSIPTLFPVCILFLHHCTGSVSSVCVCVVFWQHLPRQSDYQHYCVCVSGL